MTASPAQQTFLTILGDSHHPHARVAALRVLLKHFASVDLWTTAERDVIDLARRYDEPQYRELDALSAVARVPLASVRHGLHSVAEAARAGAERAEVLEALVSVGDAAAATSLVEYLAQHPDARIAKTLATAPVALSSYAIDVVFDALAKLDRADPVQGSVAVWYCVALARHGHTHALEAALDDLNAGWQPALFDGNPLALREQLAAIPRHDDALSTFAGARKGQLSAADRAAIDDEQHFAQPQLVLIDGLAAVAGPPATRTARPDDELAWRVEQLGIAEDVAQWPESYARYLPAALGVLTEREAAGEGVVGFEAGNALVDLVEALPAHQPDGAAIVQAYVALCAAAGERFDDLESQLGWALAQSEPNALLVACAGLLQSEDVRTVRAASALLSRSVAFRANTYGPRYGAGSADAVDPVPAAVDEQALIETAWFTKRMAAQSAGDDEQTRSGEPEVERDAQPPPEEADGQAYARLDAPGRVAPETYFEVAVGLAQRPSSGVSGGPMALPDDVGETFDLSVQLIADGFRVHADDRLNLVLKVTPEQRYPSAIVRLAALDSQAYGATRILMAQFAVAGQMIGAAARPLQVGETVAEPVTPAPGVDMVVPPRADAPDLTIKVTKGNTLRADRLVWSLETPHAQLDVTPPDDEAKAISDLGEEPGRWARNLMNQVHANTANQTNLSLLLRGTGRAIADKVPLWVRQRLYQLSAMPGPPKTVLLVSNEPNVPWELAWLELGADDGAENFLGAEFSVGRWVIGTQSAVTGKVKPPYPPPMSIGVERMAVVSGDYSATRGWQDLAGAHEEAKTLTDRYDAVSVAADGQLPAWLESAEGFDVLHFAVHGKSDMTGANGGIALTDGSMLTPEMIAGLRLKGAPFVFLNACQLGQGEQTLAEYGGVAAAFLKAGAGGVIASLWNVDDAAASALALNFYANGAELETGASGFIRQVRAKFAEPADADDPLARAPSLLLAYQFFGHPRMRLTLDFPTTHNSTEA